MKLPFLSCGASTNRALAALGFAPTILARGRAHKLLKAYDVAPPPPFDPDVIYVTLGGRRFHNSRFGDRIWADYVCTFPRR